MKQVHPHHIFVYTKSSVDACLIHLVTRSKIDSVFVVHSYEYEMNTQQESRVVHHPETGRQTGDRQFLFTGYFNLFIVVVCALIASRRIVLLLLLFFSYLLNFFYACAFKCVKVAETFFHNVYFKFYDPLCLKIV